MEKHNWKQALQHERIKLRQMSSKDRLWYLWEYYKIHFIALLLVIGLTITIGQTIYQNSFNTVLSCVYLTSYTPPTEISFTPLTTEFHDFLKLSDKEKITGEQLTISYDDSMSEMGYVSMAKMTALVAAKEVDIIIADSANIENYAILGGLHNLEQLLPAADFEQIKEHLIYASDEDGTLQPFAINLTETDFARRSNLPSESSYLAFIGNSERVEHRLTLVDYIFASPVQNPIAQLDEQIPH